MRVAILGAGVAGLMSAQALTDLGIDHDLYDREIPTIAKAKGLHYLHDNCGLPLRWITVHNYVIGVEEGAIPSEQYSRKVGNSKNNSLVNLPAFNIGYDFRQAFNLLVEAHSSKVIEKDVDKSFVDKVLDEGIYDYVISTIPLYILFPEADCRKTDRRVKKGRPDGLENLVGLNDNQVIYNIDDNDNWYRYSNVLGNEWTEVIEGGDFTIPKIFTTDFESPDERIILQGRYGKWDRKFLAHDAYYETIRRFSDE